MGDLPIGMPKRIALAGERFPIRWRLAGCPDLRAISMISSLNFKNHRILTNSFNVIRAFSIDEINDKRDQIEK